MSATLTPAPGDAATRPAGDAAARVHQALRRPARRRSGRLLGLAALLVAVFAVRVLLGDYTVTVPDLWRILLGEDLAHAPGARFVVMETKLPRALLAVLVGAAFGAAGAICQAVLRNPLASPDVIGVSMGASAAGVVAVVGFGSGGGAVPAAAAAGALVTALLVRAVAGSAGGHRLVLAGIGVSAALLSVVHYVFTRADVWDAHEVLRWLTGSVAAADWPTVRLLAALLGALAVAGTVVARTLPVQELGLDTARALGVGPGRADAALLLAVCLTGVAVAAAGPVAFVALLSAPIARAVVGRTTLLGSALVGAATVVGGDHLADQLLTDVNLPVGVVTGAVGAPFLLWLLASGRAGGRAA